MAKGLMSGSKKPDPKKDEKKAAPPAKKGAAAPVAAGAVPESREEAISPDKQPTAQEQADYEAFLDAAMDVLYPKVDGTERPNPGIIERLMFRDERTGQDESGQAVAALAATTVAITIRVQDSFKEHGRKVSPASMYHAAAELMGAIAELAAQPNPQNGGKPIYDYSEQEIEGAWIRGVDQYQQQQMASGDINKEMMQNDWGEVLGAAKAGNLGAISPELAEAASRGV